jgi:hypothetical protein
VWASVLPGQRQHSFAAAAGSVGLTIDLLSCDLTFFYSCRDGSMQLFDVGTIYHPTDPRNPRSFQRRDASSRSVSRLPINDEQPTVRPILFVIGNSDAEHVEANR